MITVTASAPTNSLTPLASPMVDNALTSTATAQGTLSSDDFSSALNGQLNLTTQSATPAEAAATALLTNADITAAVVNATAVLAENVSAETTTTPLVSMNTSAVMSEQDTAILSTVTDTLKFMTSGAKLGDTLAASQLVTLPNLTSSNALTPENAQALANQIATQTPAAILAQQVTPLQVGTSQIADAAAPVVTAQQAAQFIAASSLAQNNAAMTPSDHAAPQNSDDLIASNQAGQQNNTPTQQGTPEHTSQNGASLPAVSTLALQGTQSTTTSLLDTSSTPTPAALVVDKNATPSLTQDVSTSLQNSARTLAQTQTTLNQAASTPVPTQSSQTNAPLVTAQTAEDINTAAQQGDTKPAKTQITISAASVTATSLPAERVESTLDTATLAQLSDEVKNASGEASTTRHENDQNSPPVITDTQATSDVQLAMQMAPQVAAQDAPVETAESDVVFDRGGDNAANSDKTVTLTSAKTLLMEAVASRNSGGDAGNNNQNANSSQNPNLNTDASSNHALDNKTGVEAKTFANLFSAEKADMVNLTTPDKATPQAINTVVNKLAQDIKTDVAPLTRPLSHPQWNEDLGERIVWMNSRGMSSAEIKMNPEHMGPISVRIDLNQDQATIAFTAQNSAVRDALEASLPKLREMLSAQQVNLADVSVSQQSTSNSDSGRSAFAQAAADMSNGQQGNRQNAQEIDANGNVVSTNPNGEPVDEFENGQVIHTNGTNGLLSLYA